MATPCCHVAKPRCFHLLDGTHHTGKIIDLIDFIDFLFVFWSHSMWDLGSPTRDQTRGIGST